MKRSYKVPIASLISLLLGIHLIYNDGFLVILMFASFLFIFVLIPALLYYMIVSPLDSADLTESISRKLTTCKAFMAFTIMQFVCAGVAGAVWEQRTNGAELFCNELIVHLEQQKEQNGEYPNDIAYYLNNHNLPFRLKRPRLQYWNEGDRYTLTFVVPGGLFPRFHKYDSQKREWEIDD